MTRYYCVLKTSTAMIRYCGTSEAATAAALEPGTIYGYGRTKFTAWLDAHRRREAVPPQRPDEVQL
jgi:CRP-like cAMP-binding protein